MGMSVEDMILLEKWVESNYKGSVSLEYLSNLLFEKREYIFLAIKIPYELLVRDLEFYDNFNKLYLYNELKFVNDLKIKYGVSEIEIIKRIKQVREIRMFNSQKENGNLKKKKNKKYEGKCK